MKGFTLIEMMVGLIILTIGIVGFSGMTLMMAKGNQSARKIDEAATLVQSAIENISGVTWGNLGTDTGLPANWGLDNADIRTEGPINRNGYPIGTGTGPYLYFRHVVICTDDENSLPAGGSPKYCGSSLSGSARPSELACSGLALTNREKMIRVLVSWNERDGTCKHKHIDSLAFQ